MKHFSHSRILTILAVEGANPRTGYCTAGLCIGTPPFSIGESTDTWRQIEDVYLISPCMDTDLHKVGIVWATLRFLGSASCLICASRNFSFALPSPSLPLTSTDHLLTPATPRSLSHRVLDLPTSRRAQGNPRGRRPPPRSQTVKCAPSGRLFAPHLRLWLGTWHSVQCGPSSASDRVRRYTLVSRARDHAWRAALRRARRRVGRWRRHRRGHQARTRMGGSRLR